MKTIEEINELTSKIIGAAIRVHEEMGPGVYEWVYQRCMEVQLRRDGLSAQAQVPIPIFYCGEKITDEGFRIDLLVEDTVVVELKSVEEIKKVHKKQVLTYLRLAQKPVGLLINFNECCLTDGVHRIVDTPKDKSSFSRLFSWLLSFLTV